MIVGVEATVALSTVAARRFAYDMYGSQPRTAIPHAIAESESDKG